MLKKIPFFLLFFPSLLHAGFRTDSLTVTGSTISIGGTTYPPFGSGNTSTATTNALAFSSASTTGAVMRFAAPVSTFTQTLGASQDLNLYTTVANGTSGDTSAGQPISGGGGYLFRMGSGGNDANSDGTGGDAGDFVIQYGAGGSSGGGDGGGGGFKIKSKLGTVVFNVDESGTPYSNGISLSLSPSGNNLFSGTNTFVTSGAGNYPGLVAKLYDDGQAGNAFEVQKSSGRRVWGIKPLGNVVFYGDTLATIARQQGIITNTFSDSTDATYKGRISIGVNDFSGGTREAIRFDSDGSQAYSTIFGSATFISPVISSAAFYTTTSSRPWVSSCGTSPSIASYSTNQSGQITVGSGVTSSCTLNFGTPKWVNAPACTFSSNAAVASGTGSTTISAFTFGGTSITSDVVMYQCMGSF